MSKKKAPGPRATATGATDSPTGSGTPLLIVEQARLTLHFGCPVPVGRDSDVCRNIIVRIVLLSELLQDSHVQHVEPPEAFAYVREKLPRAPIVAADVGAVRSLESLFRQPGIKIQGLEEEPDLRTYDARCFLGIWFWHNRQLSVLRRAYSDRADFAFAQRGWLPNSPSAQATVERHARWLFRAKVRGESRYMLAKEYWADRDPAKAGKDVETRTVRDGIAAAERLLSLDYRVVR